MKTWQLSILAAAAALGLQACDVNVHSADAQDSAATSQPAESSPPAQDIASSTTTSPAPAAAATDSTALPADPATAAAGTSAAGSTPLPSDPAVAAGGTQMPPLAAPDTGAMGAAGTSGAAPSLPASADGAAAPTELARFLEENPVAPRKGDSASGKTGDGQPSAAKAEGKNGPAQGSSS